MTNDYWLSRKPKYTADALFEMARRHLWLGHFIPTMRLLRFAVARGHAEAIWLLEFLSTKDVERGRPNHFPTICQWTKWIFSHSNDHRAISYKLSCSQLPLSSDEVNQTTIIATGGNAIAQYILAKHYDALKDRDSRDEWMRRAAAQNFAQAYYDLAFSLDMIKGKPNTYAPEFGALISKSARLGCHKAMTRIISMSKGERDLLKPYDITDAEIMGFKATLSLELMLDYDRLINEVECDFDKLSRETLVEPSLDEIFCVGRVFDDCEPYYPITGGCINYHWVIFRTITIYREMTSKARQASIQTILVLRRLRVCRDIAVLIAKLVYNSRSYMVWYVDGGQK